MFKKLLPRRDIFFDFFEKHAWVSFQAAQELGQLTHHKKSASEIFERIKEFEHEGDQITHQCVELLHKTFITPMDRMDVYRLITTLDDVLDEMENIAQLILLYKLTEMTPASNKLSQFLIDATKELHAAVVELRKMKITEKIKSHFFSINHIENEADMLYTEAVGHLFDTENDPKQLIKWKEVYDHFEEAIDVCEDAANILEGIILENE